MSILSKKEKTISEIEEETEKAQAENKKLDVELSIAQKQAAMQRLKEKGLSPKDFGNRWSRIINWLRTH